MDWRTRIFLLMIWASYHQFMKSLLCRHSAHSKAISSQTVFLGPWGLLLFVSLCATVFDLQGAASNSVARVWDEPALAAIRVDAAHPPAQARNLFSVSVAMYDAWAAYDTNGAVGYIYRGKHSAADVAEARGEAISYAAWRLLKERHVYSRTAAS